MEFAILMSTFAVIINPYVKAGEVEASEPNFDVPVVNVTAIARKTAILPCSVHDLGEFTVAWLDHREKILTLEERRVIADDRISLERPYTHDWNLYIRDVKPSDSGKYMCQINTNPVKIKSVMLYVHENASIIDELSTQDITVVEGSTVQLVCNATGIPPPVITWYRRPSSNKQTAKEVVGSNGEVLVIHNISRYCEDIYECVAFNNIPPAASKEIKVTVNFAPEIHLPTKRIGQQRGKETILECRITANPQTLSQWKRGNVGIVNNHKYRVDVYEEDVNTITVSLRIRIVDEEDYGKYTCFAKNRLGEDREDMVLYEYIEPKVPVFDPTTTTAGNPSVIDLNTKWINDGKTDETVINPGGRGRNTGYKNEGRYSSQEGGSGVPCVSIVLLLFCQYFLFVR